MSPSESQKRIHGTLLTRARELRRPMTSQEAKLWQRLRGRQLFGLKFRRQPPIERFILDFYCPQYKLVVEIDGVGHAEPDQYRYDQARTQWLEHHGKRVLRFSNREVDTNIEGVLEEIGRACGVWPRGS